MADETAITGADIAALATKLDDLLATTDLLDEDERQTLHAVFTLAGQGAAGTIDDVSGFMHAGASSSGLTAAAPGFTYAKALPAVQAGSLLGGFDLGFQSSLFGGGLAGTRAADPPGE
jgi:hypothetical protein